MPCVPRRRAAQGMSPAARSWLEDSFSKKPPAPPGLGPEGSKTSPRRFTRRAAHPDREGSLGDAGSERPRTPPASYPPERKGCTPRNFPAPTLRAREAQRCAARLPALSSARRDRAAATQAASSRTAAAARATYPNVPAASCAPGRGSPASRDLLRDLGIAAGPPPRPGRHVRCCGVPGKLRGSSRLLSRRYLAPRAGDTSGRLRAPRLPEDPHGQRPPSAASSSPADRAPPRSALRPPLTGAAPGRDAGSRSQSGRKDPGVGWGVPLQNRPGQRI
jgi:hypothetical protein